MERKTVKWEKSQSQTVDIVVSITPKSCDIEFGSIVVRVQDISHLGIVMLELRHGLERAKVRVDEMEGGGARV